MRIARVLTRLNLGGPARQALASDSRLSERGHELRVFAGMPEPGEGDLFETLRARGIDVVRVPGLKRGIGLTGDLRASRFLRRAVADFRPDVIHTHASKAGALGRRAARRIAGGARLAPPAVVHTFHGHVLEGYFPGPVSRRLIAHERRLARDTHRIVCVAHATADDLVRLGVVEEDRIVVVPPGVELDELLAIESYSGVLRQQLGATEESFVVGVVGRLAEVKRPELAVEVFELLAERFPHLHLAFVGDGAERGALERRIRTGAPALRERVHLLGALAQMVPVFADLDAVLLTSRTEGAPVALIEAAAAGKPVVATAVGGVAEIVAHERTGYLGADRLELAYGLGQLLEQPQACSAMGHRARLRVAERHSADALAERLEALYETVTQEVACA